MDNSNSTVFYKSNVYPLRNDFCSNDRVFMSKVHDPFALKYFREQNIPFTTIQQKEYDYAAVHCMYAYDDDYPWGTVTDESGKEKIVCRCIKTDCPYFKRCRTDFNQEELGVLEENRAAALKIQKYDTKKKKRRHNAEYQKTSLEDVLKNIKKSGKNINEGIERISSVEPTTVQTGKPAAKPVEKPVAKPVEKIRAGSGNVPRSLKISFNSFKETKQDTIKTQNPQERTIVNAGPGTGKTWILIEKIKYMLSDLEINPSNILVLCFSRAAVEVIRNRLEEAASCGELPLNWHQVDVRTFDSFATYLIAWIQDNVPGILPDYYTLEYQNYDERIHTAAGILNKQKDLFAEYEHIIVDEVQDLVGVRAELVLSLLDNLPDNCGFTLLGDSCQALYDYLAVNDSTVMSSEQFYKELFKKYRDAYYYSLTHNYRQGDDLGELSVPYRKAILGDNDGLRTAEAKKLDSELETSGLNLMEIAPRKLRSLLKKGNLGILSRTNGQALQISSWLRAQGIQHTLQKPAHSQTLAVWIVRILTSAETDVIDKQEFSELFEKYYPAKAYLSERYWDALVSTQKNPTRTHLEIEDILRGILQNARNPLLFGEPTDTPAAITVSNVHRAKGREFDSVLVLQDVLESMTDEENNDLLEHKVCYVAITRAKKAVEKVPLKKQYIYISKDGTRRCFKAGGRFRRYLSHFEVGMSSDFNPRTFGESEEIQKHIHDLKPDTRLKLLKCPERTKRYVLYRIVPEDDEREVLGYTTPEFAKSMEAAIQRIYSTSRSIEYKYYPNTFGDVYVDGLATCISSSDRDISGAKRYGGMYIWYGISISGFAQMEKDYY